MSDLAQKAFATKTCVCVNCKREAFITLFELLCNSSKWTCHSCGRINRATEAEKS